MSTLAHYQSSLFAQGEPSLKDRSEFHRILLDDATWIDLSPGWVQGADELFASLHQELEWRGGSRPMYGKLVKEPRLHASLSGVDQRHAVVGSMSDFLATRYGPGINAGFANLYRDGNDSVAWHADRIGRHENDPIVAIVSLGAPRKFALRPWVVAPRNDLYSTPATFWLWVAPVSTHGNTPFRKWSVLNRE